MMSHYLLINFLVYVFVNAFTPGPGNILALDTATNYGWKKGKPLFFGIFSGYYVVQVICAVFVYGVGALLPGALKVLKYVGAAYILWLAIHIATSRLEEEETMGSASFLKGFLLQFVNVKIYFFGITALTGYVAKVSTTMPALLGAEFFIATVGSVATLTWVGMGVAIQTFYKKHFRVINVVLALTLLECVVGMLRV